MVKVAVVDDEKEVRDQLKKYFLKLSSSIKETIQVLLFSSGEEVIQTYDNSIDIICFDIQMQGMNGIETAKKIREKDDQVIIIFITNMAQLAIEGYSVRAMDFILKPITYYSFVLKMQNIVLSVKNKKSKTLVLNHDGNIDKINTEELYYAEVKDHYIYYHSMAGVFRQKASLKELEKKLEGLSFKRCNNCYLVNLKYVSSVKKDEILVDGEWLKISRPRKKEFIEDLTNYMGGISI